MKGTLKNQSQGGRERVPCHPQKQQAAADIEKSQNRYDTDAEVSDRLNPPDNDKPRKYCGQNSGDVRRNIPAGADGVGNGAGLGRASYAQRCKQETERIKKSQPLSVKAILQDVHGASNGCSVCTFSAKKTAQITFRIGGRHAQNSGNPAPEQSAWTTECNGSRNAYDISRSQSGCESCRKGGKAAEVFFILWS